MLQAIKNVHGSALSDLKAVVLKWLDLENPEIVDVVMATYVANNLASDPLWLLVIGPPSHAKTELLRGFLDHQHQGVATTYFLSNLTPSTLVSGKENKKGKVEPSLVFRLDGKLVILKDFTSILSMRSEHQQEIIAQFREMYDGQYTKEFGNGVSINWSGQFGLIGACTPIYDMHYGVVGQMGERFLLYRIDGGNNFQVGKRAQSIVGMEDVMRSEIQAAVHSFIDRFQDLRNVEIRMADDGINDAIVRLACIVAMGRCPVNRERVSGDVMYKPAPEGSARLTKQLTQMGMGLALVRETYVIDAGVLSTLQKIARDLIPAYRISALSYLWQCGATDHNLIWRQTKEVADGAGMITKTALRTLEDLMLVGVVKRSRDGHFDNSPYRWGICSDAADFIQKSGLFSEL